MGKHSIKRRYGSSSPNSKTVLSCIHEDCADALADFAKENRLTTSGAVHHLLRIALELPPLPPL